MSSRIVIIEDDRSVRESLAMVLGYHGYVIETCARGTDASELIERVDPQLVILDINLPGRSGIEICQALRGAGDARSVLMLTARQEVSDRVRGLDAGADDYLPKPFALDELLARVRSLLRRGAPIMAATTSTQLTIDDLRIDTRGRTAERNGDPIELTKIEFDLLELLVRNQNVVLTRDSIYEHIWGYDESLASNSLEVFVSALRRKSEGGGRHRLIHTVRGVGYVARVDGRTVTR